MWKTLALLVVAALPSARGDSLSIGNERLTYGFHGPTRADGKFLPGDLIVLAFDLNDITFDADGTASFSTAVEVTSEGKSLFKQAPRKSTARNFLGGKSLPSEAFLRIPPDFAAGTYTISVTVEDTATKARKTMLKKVEVLPAAFGLVQVGTSADPEGHLPTAPVGTLGSSLFINYAVVGFGRDKTAEKLPHITVSLRILDEGGKSTMAKALTGKAREGIAADLKVIPMQSAVTLNRVGRFTVELTATCEVSGKKSKLSFPIKVTTLE